MKEFILGVDIGGTKCAVNYGYIEDGKLHLEDKEKFPTTTVNETIITHTNMESAKRIYSTCAAYSIF